MKKYFLIGLAVFVFMAGLVWGRVFYLQRVHFMDAERYLSEKNYKLAIREYDTAMHFYTPFSSYIKKSARRLWQMGEMFEAGGKPDWALIAYSSIRSSLYGSRSLYTPRKDWIKKCDGKIAELNVKMLIAEGSIKPEDAGKEMEKHLKVLKTDRAPSPLWSVLAEAGFFGWVGSVIFVIFKGFDEKGKMRGKYALYGLASFAFCFILWAVALLNA
jgi:hypothetical protein